jgi:hypothetical protein
MECPLGTAKIRNGVSTEQRPAEAVQPEQSLHGGRRPVSSRHFAQTYSPLILKGVLRFLAFAWTTTIDRLKTSAALAAVDPAAIRTDRCLIWASVHSLLLMRTMMATSFRPAERLVLRRWSSYAAIFPAQATAGSMRRVTLPERNQCGPRILGDRSAGRPQMNTSIPRSKAC